MSRLPNLQIVISMEIINLYTFVEKCKFRHDINIKGYENARGNDN